MARARPSRTGWIVAASLAVHAALLAVLAIQAPRLRVPQEQAGPPEAVIPVLILPRVPPPAAQPGAKPQPIRLHRRPQRFAPEDTDVAPLVAPTVEERPAAPSAPGPRVLNVPPPADAVATNARTALRGRLGCANASLLGLTAEERRKCEDDLAAGAKEADELGLGPGFTAAAARKEADRRSSAMPQAAPGGRIGSSATDLGKSLGNDKPLVSVPF